MTRQRFLLVLTAVSVTGCATSAAFRAAQVAERRGDYDRAVVEYSRALKQHPGNARYRQYLERVRIRAAQDHHMAAERLTGRGLYKEALDELVLAADLAPNATSIRDEIVRLQERMRTHRSPESLAELKARTRERALGNLNLGPGGREPLGLTFTNASLRDIYQALGRVADVNFVFDPQFIDQAISIDLRNISFEQALTALDTAGHSFHQVTDSKLITIVPDTKAKRAEYEQQVVKTFYLSSADPKETIDLLRGVLGARRVAILPGANAITINDTPERVAAADRIVSAVDKQRAEIVVEVEILEVNRSTLKDYGIEITSGISGTAGIAGAVAPRTTIEEPVRTPSGDIVTDYNGAPVTQERAITAKDNPYHPENLLVTNLPGVIYRLFQSEGATRLLANPQIRITGGETATARFGDKVPVPVTTFTPLAQGGLATQPFTSYEYQTVGVNIEITPRVHQDGDVTLTLELEVSSLSGTGYQGLPTFNTRKVKSVIRLREGETDVLAGLISDRERTSLSGVPGLAEIPLLGRLFARNQLDAAQTDIVMTLTPYVVKRPEFTEEDLRSFVVGLDSGSSSSDLASTVSAPPPVTVPARRTRPAINPNESGEQPPPPPVLAPRPPGQPMDEGADNRDE
jgi:general secretion pathway protein D